jgi:ATP-dependent Lon protease
VRVSRPVESTDPGEVKIPEFLPVLPLDGSVVFPYVISPLSVTRERSLKAVESALTDHRIVLLQARREGTEGDPEPDELYEIGTAAVIMRMLKLPDGRVRILVQGLERLRVDHYIQTEPYLQARVRRLGRIAQESDGLEVEALARNVKDALEKIANLGQPISTEVLLLAATMDEPGRLADLVASNLELKLRQAQEILQTLPPVERLHRVHGLLAQEAEVLAMQQEISLQARGEMDRSHREFYLRQQLKAIQSELGDADELAEEIARYRQQAVDKGISGEGVEELEKQIRRLERTHPESAEAPLIRTWLDTLTGLPWNVCSEDDLDLERARRVLDEDHYDLERVKERILEHLAVRKLNPDSRGPLLCLAGPPGVGKTSLGRSIANALGRRFVRLSLGGVRDEAEIRGHRRTYVGALPGRILQGLQQAGTSNPVFMLDEIDKVGADYRGDPSSALLEVLDPEQNSTFRDHYLGVEYDLSRVLFITTANLLDPIQPAFLDRMEVLRLSGYTGEEKLQIALRHLIPKQRREHGLTTRHLRFTDAAVRRVIRDYTREAGLRNLERELAKICRRIAVDVAGGSKKRVTVGRRRVEELLGPRKHFSEEMLQTSRIGVATGLAWTAAGGDLLFIEAIALPGKGRLVLTGRLGEVMRESAQAALSFARTYCAGRLATDFFAEHDLHIHVPAGSVPKDGPSAGITIAAALISQLLQRPVDRRCAMTGELTQRGEVLPIGGLKEKLLAARQAGIRTVVLPAMNRRDLIEVPESLRSDMTFELVDGMEEVIDLALKSPRSGRGRRRGARK